MQCLPCGGGRAAGPETSCYRTGLPGYRQYTRHDCDSSTSVPYDVAPEDAEPDPHAGRNRRCQRLHSQPSLAVHPPDRLPENVVVAKSKQDSMVSNTAVAVLSAGCLLT